MKDKNLIDALKSVDNARMEKLNLDELPDVELKSLDEILNPTPKCEKKKWQCIDFRRWVAVAAAIVLLIVFIPKNGADAGFIKVIMTEEPGHIEYVVIENKEKPSDEKEFIVDYVASGFNFDNKFESINKISYIYRNEGLFYTVSQTLMNESEKGIFSTTDRQIEEKIINNLKVTVIRSDYDITIFWFSKYYLYAVSGMLDYEVALSIVENIIKNN